MQGFYALYYTGTGGFGHAVLVMNDGVITGADVTGGVYDGTYTVLDDAIDIKVDFVVPAGATLVTGQSLTESLKQSITANLALHFADGRPVLITTPMGPVNVIFKKLRSIK
jgi:hypothetical protein